MNNLSTCRVVVLIGGNGSNLQALIDAKAHRGYDIVGVISHRQDAYGLERAKRADIPTTVVPHIAYADRMSFEADLTEAISHYQPDIILLAGFMRILSAGFIQHFSRKILNIHPSLLPKFKGLHTHQRVLDAQEKEHGVSVHYVTEELDGGPIIAQIKIAVQDDDTAASLAERVHKAEHVLYPTIVEWIAKSRLKYEGKEVLLDNAQLNETGCQLTLTSLQGMTN